jgi:hypothetical protein
MSVPGSAAPRHDPGTLAQSWTTVQFHLQNWSFGDFKQTFRASTPLSTVKELLVSRHGRLASLRLYKDAFAPDSELPATSRDSDTLAALGFASGPQKDTAPVTRLFYDFVPHDARNPTLLAWKARDGLGVDAGSLGGAGLS